MKVEQSDRQAMVDYENSRPVPLAPAFAGRVLSGDCDGDPRVAAFAAHASPLRAEIERLREALRPFAEAAEDLDETTPDRCDMWEHHVSISVTAGDFRRARQALAPDTQETTP